jgi:hypothetical protein
MLVDELRRRAGQPFELFDPIIHPEAFDITQDTLGIFEVGETPLSALMFQAGYLTIVAYDRERDVYRLGYPNHEVSVSLQKYLLRFFTHLSADTADQVSQQLYAVLQRQKIDEFIVLLKQLFAQVPYQLHMREEKAYHGLLQMACAVAGIPAQSEYSTSHGRIDLVIEFAALVYVIEIKFNVPPAVALAQIEERRYYERFMSNGKKIILLGFSFMRKESSFDIQYAERVLRL